MIKKYIQKKEIYILIKNIQKGEIFFNENIKNFIIYLFICIFSS